ncbi:MAG: hypothetical protein R2730_12930 [Chitinophagales bacterium]
MDYADLLLSPEWQERRIDILRRDKYRCTNCLNVRALEDLVGGVFEKFIFPNQLDSIYVHSFEEGSQTPVNVDVKLAKHLNEKAFVYFKMNDLNQLTVHAIRTMTNDEFNAYNSVETTKLNYLEALDVSFDHDRLHKQLLKVEKEKLKAICEVTEQIDIKRMQWIVFKGLHVHHKYYQVSLKPWEYPDDALTTLCMHCHEELHKNKSVDVLDALGRNIGEYHNCFRCDGAGWFPEYKHIEGGICFRCKGGKYEELI